MPDIYGSDSGQAGYSQNSCASSTNQFYIGRLGRNLSSDDPNNPPYFNTTLAENIIAANSQNMKVYGYWFVYGPDASARGSRTPYEYGQAQANAAIHAYNDFKSRGFINSLTIFADIERENSIQYGWSDTDYAANQEVINGFFSKESHGTNPVYIGVYSKCAFILTYPILGK